MREKIMIAVRPDAPETPVMQIEYHPGSARYITWIDEDVVSCFDYSNINDRVEVSLSADTLGSFVEIAAANDLAVVTGSALFAVRPVETVPGDDVHVGHALQRMAQEQATQ